MSFAVDAHQGGKMGWVVACHRGRCRRVLQLRLAPAGAYFATAGLPEPTSLRVLWRATPAQGHPPPTADIVVWRLGGSRPRFGPCRCGVASRRTITPIAEIMPDRCTPEYERTLAKMGALLPYRCARSLLEELFPLGGASEVETTASGPCTSAPDSRGRRRRPRNSLRRPKRNRSHSPSTAAT